MVKYGIVYYNQTLKANWGFKKLGHLPMKFPSLPHIPVGISN